MTTQQAAAKLGVTQGRINHMIAAGRIKAVKIGPMWWIEPAALAPVRKRKPGRPRKAT